MLENLYGRYINNHIPQKIISVCETQPQNILYVSNIFPLSGISNSIFGANKNINTVIKLVTYAIVYPIFLINESFLPKQIKENQKILLAQTLKGRVYASYGGLVSPFIIPIICLNISPVINIIVTTKNGR
jgi:hypothetical protein